MKILSVFGTRPEAIKMAPIVMQLKNDSFFESYICITAQHRELLDDVLTLFDIIPDFDLNIMQDNQSLSEITSKILEKMTKIINNVKPDIILVHGDTTTAMTTALAAFYHHIPVAHVEAGLRTFDKNSPFPEEINRTICDYISDIHFAPTEKNKENLLKFGIKENNIHITGNTVIDSLLYITNNNDCGYIFEKFNLNKKLKIILLTCHRRENFSNLDEIFDAILKIVEKNDNVQVVVSVHPNPNVKVKINSKLQNNNRIHLLNPLNYKDFCSLMRESSIILTDSGGIQEEAPSLKIPTLVLRDTTERPEALEVQCIKLIGTKKNNIINEVQNLLNNTDNYFVKNIVNPYGDGKSAEKIVMVLKKFYHNF